MQWSSGPVTVYGRRWWKEDSTQIKSPATTILWTNRGVSSISVRPRWNNMHDQGWWVWEWEHWIPSVTATVSLLSQLISSVLPSVQSGWMDGRVFHNRPVSDARPSGNLLNYDLCEKWEGGRGIKMWISRDLMVTRWAAGRVTEWWEMKMN